MYSLSALVLCGVLSVIAGAIAGFLLGRAFSADARKCRDLEQKLEQESRSRQAYENEVLQHFADATSLFNRLTDNYREIHRHLAKGAERLCKGELDVPLERTPGLIDDAEIPSHLAEIQPPLDYAPKSSPEEKGMLNEEFGLREERRENGQKNRQADAGP